ncbi:MAG: NAD(P)/FAD-dependent oxidoreductase, partial [Candidatus Thorarchaeota archaeon]
SFNTGAQGNLPPNPSQIKMFPIRPVDYLWQFMKELTVSAKMSPNGLKIVVIGGGAAGVELACNINHILQTYKNNPEVSLYTKGNRLLSQFSENISQKVYKYLLKQNINVFLNSDVVEIQKGQVFLSNNTTANYDLGILATGIQPNLIKSGGRLEMSSKGEFVINPYLQCKSHKTVFATGDCSYLESAPLWKSGYHAINQGPTLLHNIIATSENTKLRPYRPTKRMITALNLGNGYGIVIYGSFSYLGKLAFSIKDRIERRYIKSHQCKE